MFCRARAATFAWLCPGAAQQEVEADRHHLGRFHHVGNADPLVRPVREIVQWFRAAGDRAPEWFDETEMTPRGTRTVTVAAGTTRSVHRLRRDFGPGGLRMRWGFDDD